MRKYWVRNAPALLNCKPVARVELPAGVGGRRVLTKEAWGQSAKACPSFEPRSGEGEFFRRPRVRGRRGKFGRRPNRPTARWKLYPRRRR